MIQNHLQHPEADEIRAYGQGRLSPEAAAAVEQHIVECDTCCGLLADTPVDSFVGRLRVAEPAVCTTADAGGGSITAVTGVPRELEDHPRYRVLGLIAQGGMGAVFKAEHRRMERPVALKVINPGLLRNPATVQRFHQEVRATAKLSHPNIVSAYDADQAGALHFLVMEFVEGKTLADLLAERGPLPIDEACDCIRQAALGLQHLHEAGLIHRDIKPHNIIRASAGTVKLLDCGLARFAQEPDAVGASPVAHAPGSPELTAAGTIMGTADYISPDQAADARSADIRSDIYSLGCTLYHLLTGRPPFPAGTPAEKFKQHAETALPIPDDWPAELKTIVGRMTAKAPAERYQTPTEVATALESLCRAGSVSDGKRRSGRSRSRLAWIAMGAVAAGLIIAAVVIIRIKTEDGREIIVQTDDPNIEIITKKNGEIVRIRDPKRGQTWELNTKNLTMHDLEHPHGLALEVPWRGKVTFKSSDGKVTVMAGPQGPSPGLPDTPDQVLPALAGAWKGEYTQKIYGGKPAEKKISAVAVNDWIVAKTWLRQRVQMETEGFQSVTTYEPGSRTFRDWFFHSRGLNFGPSTGRWDAATRTMTWTNLPEDGVILLMTLRFIDADTFTGEILIRDKEGRTVFEMTSLMKRTTENITIDEDFAAGPLPKEMAVLDRLVGDWQSTGVIKNAKNPDGLKANWHSSVRRILGGRVIATTRTGDAGDDESYSLSTFDTFSKAYGRWSFRADGSVMEYGGLWDKENQTLKWHWAGKDGSQSSNTWPLRDPNRRDWQVVTKNALGKTTFEVQATSVRQSEPGWLQLFNGKDLTGWDTHLPETWRVENGAIVGNAVGYLFSSKTYRNFHCRIEAKLNAQGAGGISFRNVYGNRASVLLGNFPEGRKTGSISQLVGGKSGVETLWKEDLIKPDTWFSVDLIVRGNSVAVRVDSVETARTTLASLSGFGVIGLHSYHAQSVIHFKKIEIKELPPEEPGWMQLFNGKDFDGWIPQARDKDKDPRTPWSIADGVLIARGGNSGVGWLRSARTYENFTLKLKFRLPRRAPGDQQYFGDTGVVIHRQEAEPLVRFTGYNLTLGRAWEGRALHVDTNKSAKIAVQEPVHYRPAGEWNDLEVTSSNGAIEASINGKLTIKLTECQFHKGYLALFAQGVPIDYRDIIIRELRP